MSRILRFLLTIIGLIIFATGGAWLGTLYQAQKDAPQIEGLQATGSATNNVLKKLSSKVVSSINAFGQVSKIEGRDITLTSSGDNLIIKINENATIFSFVQAVPPKKGGAVSPAYQKIELKDIKNGDNLTINLKLLPNGQLEGQSIAIIPVPVQNKTK